MRLLLLLLATLLVSPVVSATTWLKAKDRFELFYAVAQDETLSDEQLIEHYISFVESINPDLYKYGIYYASEFPDGWTDQRRLKVLSRVEAYRRQPLSTYLNSYEQFEDATNVALNKIATVFGDYQQEVTVALIPGVTWGGSYRRINGEDYLLLGVDYFAENPTTDEELQLLVAHEVAHHIHALYEQNGFSTLDWMSDGTLFARLWTEGMANFASSLVFPSAKLGDLSERVPIDHCVLARLGGEFLDVMHEPAINFDDATLVRRWFSPQSKTNPQRPQEPDMVGYLIGALVIDTMYRNGKSLDELMSVSLDQAESLFRSTLEQLQVSECDRPMIEGLADSAEPTEIILRSR